MGCWWRFRCRECGYHAEVSGGADIGFVIRTRTVFCSSCRELRDVVTEYWCKHLMTSAEQAELNEDAIGRCQGCGGRDVRDWSAGDPCPRCGGTVDNEGLVADWD